MKIDPWLQTYTGKKFEFLKPSNEMIDVEDISHALSFTCRFGGHCKEFYSVAQHCCLVASIVEPKYRLWALLHDAPEAYLVDLPSPLKAHINGDYQKIEDIVETAIIKRFDVEMTEDTRIIVKQADTYMVLEEGKVLLQQPDMIKEWGFGYPEGFIPYEEFPLKIEAWDSFHAEMVYKESLLYELNE